MTQQTQQTAQFTSIPDELILVVKRDTLFPEGAWQGLRTINPESYLELINKNKEFLPRILMEQDSTYKQIIPYLVFTHENKYFLMQRQKKASETRLQSKYSLGIGGHIREEDMSNCTLVDWAKREFEEEIDYAGTLKITPLGVLNDDSNTVGQVHIGFVFLITGDSANIQVKEELQSGMLYTLEECKQFYPHMETWTQIIFDHLIK
jgi:predicted NUDIX family phosphoesterase